MGDRTEVVLSILSDHKDRVLEICENDIPEMIRSSSKETITVDLTFFDVNYGELDFLSKLKKEGIAYSSHWDRGEDYYAGTYHLRFDDTGLAIEKELEDFSNNIYISTLVAIVDDHAKLKKIINEAHENNNVIGWEKQWKNGKKYLARMLLGANTCNE